MSRRARKESAFLAIAILAWTSIAWGGRMGLLTGGGDPWAWVRIGGSIVVGLAAGSSLVFASLASWRRHALWMFATWTVLLWGRSLVVNWAGTGSMGFKLIHSALALGFFALAWWAVTEATRTRRG